MANKFSLQATGPGVVWTRVRIIFRGNSSFGWTAAKRYSVRWLGLGANQCCGSRRNISNYHWFVTCLRGHDGNILSGNSQYANNCYSSIHRRDGRSTLKPTYGQRANGKRKYYYGTTWIRVLWQQSVSREFGHTFNIGRDIYKYHGFLTYQFVSREFGQIYSTFLTDEIFTNITDSSHVNLSTENLIIHPTFPMDGSFTK